MSAVKYKEDYGVSPVDNSFVNIDDSSVKNIENQTVDGQGYSLKGNDIQFRMKRFKRNYLTDVILSMARNFSCWAGLALVIVMLAAGDKSKNVEVNLLVIFIICLSIGVGFHITQGYYDLTFKNPTIICSLLRDAISREDFIRVIQQRQLSAPEVTIQLSLKNGSRPIGDMSHWSRSACKKTKEIVYNGWADQSSPVNSIVFQENKSHYVRVIKDYRCVDEETQKSISTEITEFKTEAGHDNNSSQMYFEILLQWKEADSSGDVQPFLVYDGIKALIYNPLFYKISWFCALDSIYRIIFHFNTTMLDDYYLVKFIER